MSGGDTLTSPMPLRRSPRRAAEASTPPGTRRGSGPATPGRRARSRSRTRRSPSSAVQGSPTASSTASSAPPTPQTPLTALGAVDMDAGCRPYGRRAGGAKARRGGLVLLLVVLAAAAAVLGVAALFHGPTKSAVASWLAALRPAEAAAGAEAPKAAAVVEEEAEQQEPEPVVVDAPAAPEAPMVQENEPEPEPAIAVVESEPEPQPEMATAAAAAVTEREVVAAEPEPVPQPQQQQQPPQQNASAAAEAAVPTQQQFLDAEKAEVVQRKATAAAPHAPHSFFGDAGAHANKAGKPAAPAAVVEEPAKAAAAAAVAAAAASTTGAAPKAEAAPASATGSSVGGKGNKEVKSRRKAKQQQAAAAAQEGRAAPRPRLVLRVGDRLQPGQKMGNRCFDLGPEGFCAPATYLALDAKGRLELREGWEGQGKRKWRARKRVRLGKLVQAGLRRLKGEKNDAGPGAAAGASYKLLLTDRGMLELLAPDGEWAWRSGVEGARNGTYEAFVSDDGKMVVFQGGSRVHWRSA